MANAITRTTRIGPPPVATPEQSRVLAVCLNRVDCSFGAPPIFVRSSAPSSRDIEILRDRRAVVERGLVGCTSVDDERDVAKAVLQMFDAWPGVRMDATKARATAATYTAVLQHLPVWSVQAAVRAAQDKPSPFPPSAGELRSVAEAFVEPIRGEATKIQIVLSAEIVEPKPKSEEAKRIVAALARKFGRPTVRRYQPESHDRAEQRRAAEMNKYRGEPVTISDELKQRIATR